MRKILQIYRAHSAFLTVIPLIAPLLYFNASICTILVVFFLGFLIHFAGFGMNTVLDYYHDVNDPNKRHFPHIRGELKYEHALHAVSIVFIISLIASIVVAFYYSNYVAYSLAFLLLSVGFGVVYNMGEDKASLLAPIPIALYTVFLIYYTLSFATLSIYYYIIFGVMSFLAIIYQILWLGSVKDISADKYSFARMLGCFSNDYIYISKRATVFSTLLNIARCVPLLFLNPLSIILTVPTVVTSILMSGRQSRNKILRLCMISEMCFYYALLLAVCHSLILFFMLVIASAVYTLMMNKYLWKCDYPRV